MKKRLSYGVLLAAAILVTLCLTSCDGDCRTENVEQVEWITYDQPYFIDTLVRYAVVQDSMEYQRDLKQVMHALVIKNLDRNYANTFVVSSNSGYTDLLDNEQMRNQLMDSVEIAPNSEHEFKCYGQATKTINFNRSVSIRQLPKRIRLNRRMDSLRITHLTINSCMTNIEALKIKAQTIRTLYGEKIAKKR